MNMDGMSEEEVMKLFEEAYITYHNMSRWKVDNMSMGMTLMLFHLELVGWKHRNLMAKYWREHGSEYSSTNEDKSKVPREVDERISTR